MEVYAVKSSNLDKVGWLPLKNSQELVGMLYVQFKSGSVYRYFQVPKALFEELVRADSPGMYLNRYIKPIYRVSEADSSFLDNKVVRTIEVTPLLRVFEEGFETSNPLTSW